MLTVLLTQSALLCLSRDGVDLLDDDVVQKIAKKHAKSSAQVHGKNCHVLRSHFITSPQILSLVSSSWWVDSPELPSLELYIGCFHVLIQSSHIPCLFQQSIGCPPVPLSLPYQLHGQAVWERSVINTSLILMSSSFGEPGTCWGILVKVWMSTLSFSLGWWHSLQIYYLSN